MPKRSPKPHTGSVIPETDMLLPLTHVVDQCWSYSDWLKDANGKAVASDIEHRDAGRIALMVNSHAGLVEACRAARDWFYGRGGNYAMGDKMNNALKSAGAK